MWIIITTFSGEKYYCKKIEVAYPYGNAILDAAIAVYLEKHQTVPHCFLLMSGIQSITFGQ